MTSTILENKYLSLDEIGIPPGVQLYIPTGIEGNYKSINQPEDQTTHYDWLYFPIEKIEFWKDAINNNTEFSKTSPLQFEDNWIFPLIENNKIICLLVNSTKSLSGVSSDQLCAVLEKYNYNNKITDTEDELTTELLEASAVIKLESIKIFEPSTRPASTHCQTIRLKNDSKVSTPQRFLALLNTL